MVVYSLAGLQLDGDVCSRSFLGQLRPGFTVPRYRTGRIVRHVIRGLREQPVAARCDVGQKKRAIALYLGFSKPEHVVALLPLRGDEVGAKACR